MFRFAIKVYEDGKAVYSRVDNAAAAMFKIDDGTIEVSVEGGKLVIREVTFRRLSIESVAANTINVRTAQL